MDEHEGLISWPPGSNQGERDRYWHDVLVPRIAAGQSERERQLADRAVLVTHVEAPLFSADPIGINFDTNTDGYRPERHGRQPSLCGGRSRLAVLAILGE
jgi:hypothetical protein